MVFGISLFVFLKSLKLVLKTDSANIADSKDAVMQQELFDALSPSIYELKFLAKYINLLFFLPNIKIRIIRHMVEQKKYCKKSFLWSKYVELL